MIELATNTITADNRIGTHNAVSATISGLLGFRKGMSSERRVTCPNFARSLRRSKAGVNRSPCEAVRSVRSPPKERTIPLLEWPAFENALYAVSLGSHAALAGYVARALPSCALRVHQLRGSRQPVGSGSAVENRTGAIRSAARNPTRRILL